MSKLNSKKKVEGNKNTHELFFEIETKFGKLNVVYDYRDAYDLFTRSFRKCTKTQDGYIDANRWEFAIGHAHDILIELIPQILKDALKQVWFESKARTLHELNKELAYLRFEDIKEGKKIYHLSPIEVFNYPIDKVKGFCEKVADKSSKNSHRRMRTNELLKRGGSERKISKDIYANLPYFYNFYYSQAKSILKFYNWKKELWEKESRSNTGNEKWDKHLLEIIFQTTRKDNENLQENLDNAQTKKDKLKFKELDNAYTIMLAINPDDIDRWKKTFHKILAEGYDSKISTSQKLTAKILALEFLANFFNLSTRTIENNIKELNKIISLIRQGD